MSDMQKTFHIAKANILRHKGASLSLFMIILIVSALITIGLSVMLGVDQDFHASVDRLHSLHSAFVLRKDQYNPSFEDILKEDPRVSQYEISEVVCLGEVTVDYGGEIELRAVILNLDNQIEISAPKMMEQDPSIPQGNAIYLPIYAKGLGYAVGEPFTITYKNRPFGLTIAGFFETNELSTAGMSTLRFFVPDACFEKLKQQFGSAVFLAVRFLDINDSEQFDYDFASRIDIDLSDFLFEINAYWLAVGSITPVAMISVLLIAFALLIALISLSVIRFRVKSNIEDTLHEIGVLKSSGYTSAQIIACYTMEYGILSLPAAIIGVFVPGPAFSFIRQILTSVTGSSWTLGTNMAAGLIAALLVVFLLLAMVRRSCRKIKKLPPVTALRGGIAANSFRRNFFPLHTGAGDVQTRLGLKSMFTSLKSYVMIGTVIAGIALAITFMIVVYQNIGIDQMMFARMAGLEAEDMELRVTRHTDADALAAGLETMPEVRKTLMLDYVDLKIEGITGMGYVSGDFDRMESMSAHDGRLPKYDNEAATSKLFADRLGKKIGDAIEVHANGVTQEYMLTGFYSVMSNSGRVAAITMEGYQRLDPNYRRRNVNVYLNEGIAFNDFSETLQKKFGVLNLYRQGEHGEYAAAKARAEEKISNYLEQHAIDSVEYAVILRGDIILSGSSSEYQIERITNIREVAKAQIGRYSSIFALLTQIIAMISLIIISLILSMTVQTIVTRRRREFGTLKAVGFTTKQLARQLAISFLPLAAVGVVIGCIAGALLVNPVMGSMLASTGAYGAVFVVNPLIIAIVGGLILLATFIVADISAKRIKNVSVYELLSE